MGKRLFPFIIFILALIGSINGRGNDFLSTGHTIVPHFSDHYKHRVSSNDANTGTVPLSSGFTQKHNGPDKNLIRIKAWHNIIAFDIPVTWRPVAKFSYAEKDVFINYCSKTLSLEHPLASLRGPPQYNDLMLTCIN